MTQEELDKLLTERYGMPTGDLPELELYTHQADSDRPLPVAKPLNLPLVEKLNTLADRYGLDNNNVTTSDIAINQFIKQTEVTQ